MTTPSPAAPELQVHSWLNTDRPLSLAVLRGRVVVLVAFQALCPQSVSSAIPLARRIHETFEPKDVTVIGLHSAFEFHDAHNPSVMKAFVHQYRLKFPIAFDEPAAAGPIPLTMERYKMRGTPSLILIDRHGSIRKHAFGAVDDLRIGAEIGVLIQESGIGMAALPQSSAA